MNCSLKKIAVFGGGAIVGSVIFRYDMLCSSRIVHIPPGERVRKST